MRQRITETSIKTYADSSPLMRHRATQIEASGIAVTPAAIGPGAAAQMKARVSWCHSRGIYDLGKLNRELKRKYISKSALIAAVHRMATSGNRVNAIDSDGVLKILIDAIR